MKTIGIVLLSTMFLAGCKNEGQHLGNFKNNCESRKGKLEQTSPNNYKCTLPDGTVLFSK